MPPPTPINRADNGITQPRRRRGYCIAIPGSFAVIRFPAPTLPLGRTELTEVTRLAPAETYVSVVKAVALNVNAALTKLAQSFARRESATFQSPSADERNSCAVRVIAPSSTGLRRIGSNLGMWGPRDLHPSGTPAAKVNLLLIGPSGKRVVPVLYLDKSGGALLQSSRLESRV